MVVALWAFFIERGGGALSLTQKIHSQGTGGSESSKLRLFTEIIAREMNEFVVVSD